MVSIIKNQLLKHLSRFTKNLSADKINISTFKGEGELSNLELDEIVLTDLLELPCWLRLTQAWCNKVYFRIPWTKLKSVPICLNLDEVYITLETCEELRVSSTSPRPNYGGVPSKYSFIHKVIDGITVGINTVNIVFNSPAFTASVQITRILVESKTPKFTQSDLRMTRLKNQEKGQLLIFKELVWQNMRIEAKSTVDKDLTPLRLLTNQARCRIVMKKRLSDCFILGSRLVIILDELLWVLTDSQLKAVLHFLESLTDLVQKATQMTRIVKAARKLEELPEYQAQMDQETRGIDITPKSSLFAAYDVIETSYHFLSNQIVLHLCDDPGSGRSSHPNLQDGGALQVTLKQLQIDYYPYHLAKGNRKHWPKYNVSSVPHPSWQDQSFNYFRNKLMDIIDENNSQHSPLKRPLKEYGIRATENTKQNESGRQKENKMKMMMQLSKIMTTCAIVRMNDFIVYKVTTSNNKQGLKELLFGERGRTGLPKNTNIIHAEFIYYYYTTSFPFPLPPPKFYVQLNPITFVYDLESCLWLNAFGLNLFTSATDSRNEIQLSSYTYVDVRIEAILLKVSFGNAFLQSNHQNRPKSLAIYVTKAVITNVRGFEESSRADLAKCLDSLHMGSLFFGTDFPSDADDLYVVTQKFVDHISADDDVRKVSVETDSSFSEIQFTREMLWTEARDIWFINLDPVWGEFYEPGSINRNKYVTFLEAIPVTIWLHTHLDPNSTLKPVSGEIPKSSNADIHVLVHISNLISIQINHYQYLFLLRLAEDVTLLTTLMSKDAENIFKVVKNSSIIMGALLPQLELNFVMPALSTERDILDDVDSFIPPISSVTVDETSFGSSFTLRRNNSSDSPLNSSRELVENEFSSYFEKQTNIHMELGKIDSDIKHPLQEEHKPKLPNAENLNLPTNLNSGLSSMKKGFNNLMSSIDSALKPSPEDVSDNMSIRSDVSSDSEKFVYMNCEPDIPGKDLMFFAPEFLCDNEPIEEASEVLEQEDNISSPCDSATVPHQEKNNYIMVATFKLEKIEFVHQSIGYSSSLKIQVGELTCDECPSISWHEFQVKFRTRSTSRTGLYSNIPTRSKVKLRLDHEPAPYFFSLMDSDITERDQFLKIFKDSLFIKVNDLSLHLKTSTLAGLAELTEDEFLPTIFELKVTVENVQIDLEDDHPSVNVTSFDRAPLVLNVIQLYIFRNEDGIFNISPTFPMNFNTGKFTESEIRPDLKNQLYLDNEELRRRLMAFERVSEENRSLRKTKEESTILRSRLKKSQEEIAQLITDKTKLINEIKKLREQISSKESSSMVNSSKR
ncbi:bridge-like lipid transfer protein family member 3B [Leptinotarsa decemlineata]|uniref:bridge-like lipid transfer protein family member 3B n=1 Tax=Leptinotarsa decemlineata TaxID=7539 RepID=UPI003D3092FA